MTNSTCQTCRNWKVMSKAVGECRAYPPTIQANNGVSHWPTTCDNDWCGEHFPIREEGGGDAAVTMFNGKDYNGRALVVNEARPMEARPPRRDFNGGGNSRGGGYGSRNNY